MTPATTLGPVRAAFRAVTVAAVPAAASLDEAAWARAEGVVDQALAARPPAVRRQVVLFFRVVDVLARLRFGRGLAALSPERTRRLLGALERSPFLLLRRGCWGVRTLAFMGYYGRAEARAALGYRAALRGWERPGAKQGPWPGRAGAAPVEPGVLVARGDGGDETGG